MEGYWGLITLSFLGLLLAGFSCLIITLLNVYVSLILIPIVCFLALLWVLILASFEQTRRHCSNRDTTPDKFLLRAYKQDIL